jgi:hypothetical protein
MNKIKIEKQILPEEPTLPRISIMYRIQLLDENEKLVDQKDFKVSFLEKGLFVKDIADSKYFQQIFLDETFIGKMRNVDMAKAMKEIAESAPSKFIKDDFTR